MEPSTFAWTSLVVFMCTSLATADIYFHIPRGSNNRLNEKSAARKNANRMFDSQNNNRGGYNVGDSGSAASTNETQQYRMKYFQSDSSAAGKSVLTVEWTNQHGCGGNEDSNPQKQNCILVLQYACQDDVDDARGQADTFRNGKTTQTAKYSKPGSLTETKSQKDNRKSGDVSLDKGLHESWDWYNKCYTRQRNKGLFTADQNLKANNGLGYSSAIYTRQNPNGNRYGYECPEERDYYPYWHPTMWKDIAVMAENASMCSYYTSKSFNVQPYGECLENKGWSKWRTQEECQSNSGTWILKHNYLEKATQYKNQGSCEQQGNKYVWGVPSDAAGNELQCLVKLSAPDCFEAPWSRSNHLGNGVDGKALTYDWTLPYFPSGKTQRCVLRIRYNISTDDYDPHHTDHTKNNDILTFSPVQQNPYIDIGGRSSALRLAINTAQYGRVFQDRSHVFQLRPRPAGLQGARIFNLNVRGKRGNIVQVYPAVEYDFAPTRLEIKEGDLVHIQWTGSNSHNNGNPAGDGQAGDAGEGTSGTDRNNMVEILDPNDNYPVPFEQSTMWDTPVIKWIHHGKTGVQPKDLAVDLASAGYYRCIRKTECQAQGSIVSSFAVDQKPKLQSQLNNAPASYEGVMLRFKKGTHHYMCTRNNNFTNRSQKGTIVVK
ncbi:protein DD3-3-like [Littorina saxatilis]|uniref:Protein DD3-3 n=1 Tax=Littorina saxatilis TaxID=31220 RepID=A0AAN9GCC8_9CAEN